MKTRSSQAEDGEESSVSVGHPSYRGFSKQFHRRLSSVLLALMIALVAGYAILVLYVPKVAELWKRAGVDLTPTQQSLVRWSEFAVQNGAAAAIVVLSCFVVAFALRIYCSFR